MNRGEFGLVLPRNAAGQDVPIVRPLQGAAVETADLSAAGAALQVRAAAPDYLAVRVHGLGAGMRFAFGGAGVAAPGTGDQYAPPDGYVETLMKPGETHVRAAPRGATGALRVEPLETL